MELLQKSSTLELRKEQESVEENKGTEISYKEEKDNSKTDKSKLKLASSKHKTLKFAGPIKLIVIESESEYCKTIWCAIGIGFTHVMIGATNMTIFMYSLRSGEAHATLCCLAYHFFSAEAILSFNYVNGWSTPMRLRHRRFVHISLQLCGIACALAGTTEVLVRKGISKSMHGFAGIITAILAVVSLVSGRFGLSGGKYLKLIHVSCGMPTFLMSSISLCTGLFTAPFKGWADLFIIYLLTGFVIFYSVFIITTCFIKCMIRI